MPQNVAHKCFVFKMLKTFFFLRWGRGREQNSCMNIHLLTNECFVWDLAFIWWDKRSNYCLRRVIKISSRSEKTNKELLEGGCICVEWVYNRYDHRAPCAHGFLEEMNWCIQQIQKNCAVRVHVSIFFSAINLECFNVIISTQFKLCFLMQISYWRRGEDIPRHSCFSLDYPSQFWSDYRLNRRLVVLQVPFI